MVLMFFIFVVLKSFENQARYNVHQGFFVTERAGIRRNGK